MRKYKKFDWRINNLPAFRTIARAKEEILASNASVYTLAKKWIKAFKCFLYFLF